MRKLILVLGLLFVSTLSYADSSDRMYPASNAVSITSNITTQAQCRGVWIGTTQSIDLFVNGSWITFQGASAGTVIPVFATGARITSGAASPNSGDVVFLS